MIPNWGAVVGDAAIQLARWAGANVITTAGADQKWNSREPPGAYQWWTTSRATRWPWRCCPSIDVHQTDLVGIQEGHPFLERAA
jgi:hypothetical protein